MTSAYAAQSNRQNSQKSTGPRSQEGKECLCYNALKHGGTSRLLVLPGEQAEELERQRDAWIASRGALDPVEQALVERAFEAWHQLGGTLRAQQARVEKRMHEAESVEQQQASDTVLELGNRLFSDRRGPYQCDHTPKDAAEARQVLAGLADRAASRLRILLADREAREHETAAGRADRHAFDLDRDGELMRRYEISCDRAFHRALERLRMLRKDAQAHERDTRTAAGEAWWLDGVDRTAEPATETHAPSLVSPMLSIVERPLPETGSVAPPSPPVDNFEPATGDGRKLRNEAVAAFMDRDDWANQTGDLAEPATGSRRKLRNEAVAGFIDRDDWANQTGDRAEPATGSRRKLRNEAVAGSTS